ncbi:MAG: sensor histidine kinase [Kiritimatiellae bacterium]|nr:sensor histidine kinase [Kiritimatiellia bacterium]
MGRLLLMTAVMCVVSPSAMAATNAVLTTTAELRALSENEALAGLRFDLTAQVILKTTGITGCAFSVQDKSGGVHLFAEDNPQSFTYNLGDVIRWRGTTGLTSDRNLYVKCDKTDLVGRRPLPPVIQAEASRIPLGDYNYRRISLTGIVTGIYIDDIDPSYDYVVMRSSGCTIYAALQIAPSNRLDRTKLVDAEVEVSGVCIPEESGRRIFLGHRLGIADIYDIRVLRAPPSDPFSVPYIGNIHHVRAGEVSAIGRRRIDGRVIATWGGNRLMLRADSGNAVRVELSDGALPPCGSHIAVVGLPATDLFHLNLSQGMWKALPGGMDAVAEKPADVSAEELLFNEHGERKFNPRQQGQLFRLVGTVRSLPAQNDPSARMLLSCDGNIIPVDASSSPAALDGLEVDCRVAATGICVLDVPNWSHDFVFPRIEGLFLVPRTPSDIEVVARPPWWTPKKLVIVIASLFALLALGALWIRILNRIILRRSRLLAKERIAHDKAETRIDERTRLAVELHDALSQTLTGVAFQIDAAEKARMKNPSKIEHYLSVARRTLASCREELRNCLWDLQNHALDAKDAAEAIRETLDPHTEACDVDIDVDMPRARISDQTFHAVLRIVRELVVNAIRQGKAEHIRVCGHLHENVIAFSVSDDGVGFDPETRPGLDEGHFGLHGIYERVERLSGSISIDSAPGRGTKINVELKMEN